MWFVSYNWLRRGHELVMIYDLALCAGLNFCPRVFQRHGIAVFLAITMCTSLLFVYSVSYNNNTTASSASKGASGEKVEPTSAPRAPPALQGYSSIIEHKVNASTLCVQVKLIVRNQWSDARVYVFLGNPAVFWNKIASFSQPQGGY